MPTNNSDGNDVYEWEDEKTCLSCRCFTSRRGHDTVEEQSSDIDKKNTLSPKYRSEQLLSTVFSPHFMACFNTLGYIRSEQQI